MLSLSFCSRPLVCACGGRFMDSSVRLLMCCCKSKGGVAKGGRPKAAEQGGVCQLHASEMLQAGLAMWLLQKHWTVRRETQAHS